MHKEERSRHRVCVYFPSLIGPRQASPSSTPVFFEAACGKSGGRCVAAAKRRQKAGCFAYCRKNKIKAVAAGIDMSRSFVGRHKNGQECGRISVECMDANSSCAPWLEIIMQCCGAEVMGDKGDGSVGRSSGVVVNYRIAHRSWYGTVHRYSRVADWVVASGGRNSVASIRLAQNLKARMR